MSGVDVRCRRALQDAGETRRREGDIGLWRTSTITTVTIIINGRSSRDDRSRSSKSSGRTNFRRRYQRAQRSAVYTTWPRWRHDDVRWTSRVTYWITDTFRPSKTLRDISVLNVHYESPNVVFVRDTCVCHAVYRLRGGVAWGRGTPYGRDVAVIADVLTRLHINKISYQKLRVVRMGYMKSTYATATCAMHKTKVNAT